MAQLYSQGELTPEQLKKQEEEKREKASKNELFNLDTEHLERIIAPAKLSDSIAAGLALDRLRQCRGNLQLEQEALALVQSNSEWEGSLTFNQLRKMPDEKRYFCRLYQIVYSERRTYEAEQDNLIRFSNRRRPIG